MKKYQIDWRTTYSHILCGRSCDVLVKLFIAVNSYLYSLTPFYKLSQKHYNYNTNMPIEWFRFLGTLSMLLYSKSLELQKVFKTSFQKGYNWIEGLSVKLFNQITAFDFKCGLKRCDCMQFLESKLCSYFNKTMLDIDLC